MVDEEWARGADIERPSRFLAGLNLVQPGLVWVSQWRGGELVDGGADPQRIAMLAAVARKP